MDSDETQTQYEMIETESYGWESEDLEEPVAETKLWLLDTETQEPFLWIWLPLVIFEPTQHNITEGKIWHEQWGLEMRDTGSVQSLFIF